VSDQSLRAHLRALLTEPQAHVTLEGVLDGFPLERLNERIGGLPYSAWELLWHLWFTQRDILDFVQDAPYTEHEWPAAYWPKSAGTVEQWHQTFESIQADLDEFLTLLDGADLYATVPNAVRAGTAQTWLREALLIADHNAYHLGQLVLLRRLLEEEG
jgi:uncharacterized damage-inducible protein DinB